MEEPEQANQLTKQPDCAPESQGLARDTYRRPAFVDSVLTDAVLSELKKQSVNGCLLCSFDTWDGEDWD